MTAFGGYALHRGDGTSPATLTLDGQPIGTVHLHPDAGHHTYEFVSADAARAYLLFADQVAPDALEPDDVLTDRLAVADNLNQSLSVVFVTDEEDFYATGRYRTYGPNVPFDDVVARLTGSHRLGGDQVWLVWVPARSQFVPATALTAPSPTAAVA